jgi:DNA-binding NarL/FixJ family response regulator
MGGLEATRLIKAAMPDVPIVILTASKREVNLFEAVKSEALGYVLKTMSSAELVRQIDAAARGVGAELFHRHPSDPFGALSSAATYLPRCSEL